MRPTRRTLSPSRRALSRIMGVAPLLALLGLALARPVQAEPLLPGAVRAELHTRMAAQQHGLLRLNAYTFGLPQDAMPRDAEAAERLGAFVAAGPGGDPRDVGGEHVFELLAAYGQGSISMFGGVAAAGVAYRYRVLKAAGAPAAQLEVVLRDLVRAAQALHVIVAVTGEPGVVARGIWRRVPEDPADPPIPGSEPAVVPLRDEQGRPLPEPKDNGTWRADNSGGTLPEGTWLWLDSCSKDQLVGFTFGLAAVYDALRDDPAVDPALVETLQRDAAAVGHMLMRRHTVTLVDGSSAEMDLLIADADGRLTYHSDLHPFALERYYIDESQGLFLTFNAVMAMGIVSALRHVSGDQALQEYLYGELMGQRRYHERVLDDPSTGNLAAVYMGRQTNFSGVHMMALALWQLLHYEHDDELARSLAPLLETLWWDAPESSRTAAVARQPFYHMLYLGLTERGTAAEVVAAGLDLLEAFRLPPLTGDAIVNCDDAELAAGRCVAVDGSELVLDDGLNRGDHPVANQALWPNIRPPSNFHSRSDPFEVNGDGGLALFPASDLLTSYWLARLVPRRGQAERWRSPWARPHPPVPPAVVPGDDGGAADGGLDAGADGGSARDTDLGAPDGGQLDATSGSEDAGWADLGPSEVGGRKSDQGTGAGSGAGTGEDSGCGCHAPAGGLRGLPWTALGGWMFRR